MRDMNYGVMESLIVHFLGITVGNQTIKKNSEGFFLEFLNNHFQREFRLLRKKLFERERLSCEKPRFQDCEDVGCGSAAPALAAGSCSSRSR